MRLRPMLMSDADFMLGLKNDPDTRRFALATTKEIKKEDHYKWLEKNIQWFYIIEDGGTIMRRVGAIRIEDNEVSIWIDRKYRGMRYATSTLRKMRTNNMTAKIMIGNVPSMRAFIRAGFLPFELRGNPSYYLFQFKTEMFA